MQVIVDIPDEFAAELAPAGEDAARKMLEDHTAQAYREGKLSTYQVQCILGLPTRMHVDPFLLKYEIYDYTIEDLEKDLDVLERLRGVIVVADTGPLNYLIQLDLAFLLGELYGEVLIPDAVAGELAHFGTPPAVNLWMARPPFWLKQVSVKQLDLTLPLDLGDGESEAISLAMELGLAILLDDQRGRRAAAARGLETAGTPAVLIQGAVRGSLDLRETFDRLKSLEFRMSAELEALAIAKFLALAKRNG